MKKGERQYVPAEDITPKLNKEQTKQVQSIIGSLLYYAQAIDNTLLPALNTISAQQAEPMESTMKQCKTLLDYVATYPSVGIRFKASNMILNIDSDAAYLVSPKARSRIAGFYQLNDEPRSGKYL